MIWRLALAAFLALCLCAIRQAPAQFNGCAAGFCTPAAVSGAAYTGPIDINGTAFALWSTRCGATAYAGNVVDIWDAATGSTTETLVTCSSGGTLNTGSPTALATTCAASCRAKIIYDQSGSNKCSGGTPCDLTQNTNANRSGITTSCQNSKICLVFVNTNGNCYTTPVLSASQAQPFTISYTVQTSGSLSDHTMMDNSSNANNVTAQIDSTGTAQVKLYAGLTAVAAATTNALHSVQGLYNGASSSIYVDGGATTGLNAFTSGLVTQNFGVGAQKNGGGTDCSQSFMSSNWFELGIWSSDKTANNSTMNSNQHTYWNF